jgi:hypothetical protein
MRWDAWYTAHGTGYFQALDDVWDNVPEAREWIAKRKAELDPARF